MGLTRMSLDVVELNGIRVDAPITGDVFYVDSVLGSNSRSGTLPEDAVATLDKAMDLVTANKGDVIYLMPGHVESSALAATWDVDVAGVTVIGLGHGSARPRFDYDDAAAVFTVGASGCVIKNITLRPSVAAVLIGIDIETLFTDTLIEDVEILPGEAGDGTDEFTIGIALKVGCVRTVIRRFKERQHPSAGGTIAGVQLTGRSDDVLIEDCDIYILGAGVLAPINGITTLSINFRARGNTLMTDAEPGIEMLTGTLGVVSDNYIYSDLATLNAAIVADGCASFNNQYVETGDESGGIVGTPSVND